MIPDSPVIRIVLAAALCFGAAAASAQDLVVEHEKIADEKLWAAAKAEREIVLYGTIPTESMTIALEQFRKDTGVAYEYIRLPTAKMYDRVLAEYGAGKLDADYVGLTDLPLIKAWAERGILARYKVTAFAELPKDLRDDAGSWYYLVRPISTLAVNTEMVSAADMPKSWIDILDPKWKGRIGMPSMDAGGSALTLYSFLRLKVAPDFWPRLAANEPRIYATAAPVVNDLVRGRTAVSMSGASGYIQQIKTGAPVKVIFPAEGLAAFGEIGNVTSSARHPNAARLYLSWITSKRGSTMVSRQGSYGTHPAAPPPDEAGYAFPPPAQVWTIRPDEWERYQEAWPREWKAIFERK